MSDVVPPVVVCVVHVGAVALNGALDEAVVSPLVESEPPEKPRSEPVNAA